MNRKSIVSVLLGLAFAGSVLANSVTTVVSNTAFVNLLSGFNNSVQVSQILLTASNGTNTSLLVLDAPTNSLTYVNPAYSNTVSYATNYVTSWTNYYGVVSSTTNTALIDVANQAVASTTNSYPYISIAASAGTTVNYSGVNYYFNRGIWATNNSGGVATVTITYK